MKTTFDQFIGRLNLGPFGGSHSIALVNFGHRGIHKALHPPKLTQEILG
jgi:hypothetical protein